jgi:D-3-phosphoglycerate dehydrogenase
MIGGRELAMTKPSVYLINCARGDLIVEEALVDALQRGVIAGAALDVFVDEPNVSPALCKCPNLILTPHLGASTAEAQSSAALQVARQVLDVFEGKPPRYPVNVTAIPPKEMAFLQPYLDLAYRMGRFYAQFAENNLTHIEMIYAGHISEHNTDLLTTAALSGLLSEAREEPVNLVNARLVASERGLIVSEVRTIKAEGFSDMVTLRATTTARESVLGGTIIRGQPHILRVDDHWLDFIPQGFLLVSEHIEQPGVIGQMGTLLGNAGINISFIQVGRESIGGQGLMVTGLDGPLSQETLAQVMTLPSIRSAHTVSLPSA